MPGKDDSKIIVDPTLIDKRFNFWNLPKTAKVLLISNLPIDISRPRALFHLFSFYGDVARVKILPDKVTVALVEYETATMACIARNNLDQLQIHDKKLVVSFSRFGTIKKPEIADGLTEDYTGAEFKKLHRFCQDDLMAVNLKRICRPTSCLHVNNMQQGYTTDKIKELFENCGLEVLDIVAVKKVKERKEQGPNAPSRAMVFVQLKNPADALIGLALVLSLIHI